MMYRLIQRAIPGWFPYNSLHVMQPFFTKAMNKTIAEEIGTIQLYTVADPTPPRTPVILVQHPIIQKVLKDQQHFVVPWLPALNYLFPGKKDFKDYMLGGDQPVNTAQRNLVGDIIYSPPEIKRLLMDFVCGTAATYLKSEAFNLGKSIIQVDIIRE